MRAVHHQAAINGISMHYVEQGAGLPVILCHGFPHTWYVWHRQIGALVDAGCRVIIPDMRGMGQTSAPAEVEAYDVNSICGDLLGLLEHIGEERAVFAGLDFGIFAIYDLALRHPEKVIAVIALENPAAPHNPAQSPLAEYREMGRDHFLHINYFVEQNDIATADMRERVELFFHKVFWTLSGKGNYFDVFKYPVGAHYIDAMNDAPPLPWSWLCQEELDVFIEAYRRSGFAGALNWYRSMDIKWEQRKAYHGIRSAVPAYFIGSEHDLDLKGFHGDDPINLLRRQFPDLRRVEMLPEAGHLIQLEKPVEVSALMVDFIRDIQSRLP